MNVTFGSDFYPLFRYESGVYNFFLVVNFFRLRPLSETPDVGDLLLYSVVTVGL